MTITAGAFDADGVPQGKRNRLDDLDDVDTSEAEEGNTIQLRDGRWAPASGNEVVISNIVPLDSGVELWLNPDEEAEPGTGGGGGGSGSVIVDPLAPATAPVDLIWVDIDDTTGGGADSTYVSASGGTMTGRLVIDNVPTGTDTYNTALAVIRATYPEIKLLKQSSPAGTAADWRVYISGINTDGAPALSVYPRNAAGAHTGGIFRVYGDRVIQMEGTAPTAAGEIGAVLKLKWGTAGDDRGIGVRDNRDYGHPAGIAMSVINYPEGTLAPLSTANPNSPQHTVTKLFLETFTAGAIAFSDGWSNYGGIYGTVQPVLSTTGLVTMEGLFRHAAGRSVIEGNSYPLGVIPAGYRPVSAQILAGYGANPHQAIRVNVDATGTMTYIPTMTGTLGYLSFSGHSWRSA